MKLYHIDRSGHIKSGDKIELKKDFYTDITQNDYFKDGLSSHGLYFYLGDSRNNDFLIDAIFEYERMINYPNKLSRYQAFYAFDKNGVIEFIKKKNLNDNYFKIFEIDVNNYEKHNMNLVRGWSHCIISKSAKLYWEDKEDPVKDRKPIYEYLIKPPVIIGKEVNYNDLLKIYEEEHREEKE